MEEMIIINKSRRSTDLLALLGLKIQLEVSPSLLQWIVVACPLCDKCHERFNGQHKL